MRTFKKIYLSVLSFLLISIVFGTASYAWLTMSVVNNLENLSLTASSGNELEISLDGDTYSTSIENYVLAEFLRDVRLQDVTSVDGVNFLTGGIIQEGPAIRNSDYLSFDIYFRTIRRENSIYLINNVSSIVEYDEPDIGTFIVSRGVSWTAKHNFQNGPELSDMVLQGDTGVYHASNSIRISVQELINTQNELDHRSLDDMKIKIFDLSKDMTRGYGAPYGQFSYFQASTQTSLDLPSVVPETIYELTEFHELNPYQALNNTSLLTTLQPTGIYDTKDREYFTGKVRINIWIEGWDADAFDSISTDRIRIQLQFKVANPAITN
ncbi:MAG: hypothetical protein A2102_02265 [Tenericutes bacterium GWF2_38_8]|nr:MAG: hypothetical protein A2102_02265 [Tenericutes bacterium GWF2_38_8]